MLKSGNKEKVLYEVWNENDFDTDFSAVELCVAGKFVDVAMKQILPSENVGGDLRPADAAE